MDQVLLYLVGLPVLGAILVAGLGHQRPEWARPLTLVNVLLSFILCVVMVSQYNPQAVNSKGEPQTLQMAMNAVRRAGPFEPVGHLPRPWQFSETFLYNDDLKFQIRSLAEQQ